MQLSIRISVRSFVCRMPESMERMFYSLYIFSLSWPFLPWGDSWYIVLCSHIHSALELRVGSDHTAKVTSWVGFVWVSPRNRSWASWGDEMMRKKRLWKVSFQNFSTMSRRIHEQQQHKLNGRHITNIAEIYVQVPQLIVILLTMIAVVFRRKAWHWKAIAYFWSSRSKDRRVASGLSKLSHYTVHKCFRHHDQPRGCSPHAPKYNRFTFLYINRWHEVTSGRDMGS